jgi:hypothetical protein
LASGSASLLRATANLAASRFDGVCEVAYVSPIEFSYAFINYGSSSRLKCMVDMNPDF